MNVWTKRQVSYRRLLRLAQDRRPVKMLNWNAAFLPSKLGPEVRAEPWPGTLQEVALSANRRVALKMSDSFHLSWDSESGGELSRCFDLLGTSSPTPTPLDTPLPRPRPRSPALLLSLECLPVQPGHQTLVSGRQGECPVSRLTGRGHWPGSWRGRSISVATETPGPLREGSRAVRPWVSTAVVSTAPGTRVPWIPTPELPAAGLLWLILIELTEAKPRRLVPFLREKTAFYKCL